MKKEKTESASWKCSECGFINPNFGYMKELCRNLDCRKWKEEERKREIDDGFNGLRRLLDWSIKKLEQLRGKIKWEKK